ncbi:hypothetical protein ACH8KY_005255, partial [Salmonella enterica subsp. enterica serovar Braenderup]
SGGNISVDACNSSTGNVTGVLVTNAKLNATGNISINGVTKGTYSGVRFNNVNMTANSDSGSITVYGESDGVQYQERGSIFLSGTNAFKASNIVITGKNLYNGYMGSAGVTFDYGNDSFSGNTLIEGYGYGEGIGLRNELHLDFNEGHALFKGQTTGPGGSDSYYGSGGIIGLTFYQPARVFVNLTNASLQMDADSSSSKFGATPAFGIVNPSSDDFQSGFVFQGNGDVNISGVSSDGNAVDTRLFDNTALNGNVSVAGKSESGSGVYMGGGLNVTLLNATITGSSGSGNGVTLDATSGTANLGNNSINGTSETGTGIQIKGNNITLTTGTL